MPTDVGCSSSLRGGIRRDGLAACLPGGEQGDTDNHQHDGERDEKKFALTP